MGSDSHNRPKTKQRASCFFKALCDVDSKILSNAFQAAVEPKKRCKSAERLEDYLYNSAEVLLRKVLYKNIKALNLILTANNDSERAGAC